MGRIGRIGRRMGRMVAVERVGEEKSAVLSKPPYRSWMVLLGLIGVAAWGQLVVPEAPRNWTTAEGEVFRASLMGFDGATVGLRMPNGQRVDVEVERLSEEDRRYLEEWRKKQPIVMPEVVAVEASEIRAEVVSEDPESDRYVYRTQHFEFESQGKFMQSLLREVAQNFEATYELLKALPWDIDPKPAEGEYFRARLLRDVDTYYAAGGPPNSGGVYSEREGVFLVPFESIGLKTVGKNFAKGRDYDTQTLVHELTHQMMHFWLDYLPQWVVEGTAEYTAVLPLRAGRFRVSAAKSGLKNYVVLLKYRTMEGVPEPYPLEPLFFITNNEWNAILAGNPAMSRRLYFTSFLLVYYFMHLDGKGDGERFVRYFREVGEMRKVVENYARAVEEFKKQPGVEVLENGRYRWRDGLKHPEMPEVLAVPEARDAFQKKTLQILLDGRSEEELMKEIRSAYRRLGVRI